MRPKIVNDLHHLHQSSEGLQADHLVDTDSCSMMQLHWIRQLALLANGLGLPTSISQHFKDVKFVVFLSTLCCQ